MLKESENNIKMLSITENVKMKKIYCIICGKYRKFKIPKIPYIFEKILVVSIFCCKYRIEDEKIFKEQ